MSVKFTDAMLDEIRARLDLAEVIGARVELKKTGSAYKGRCPFHHEKTPSFQVNPDKQYYHCFGCGESGDIFKFIMKMDGLTFPEAVQKLAERAGVKLEEVSDKRAKIRTRLYALHAELAMFYQRCLEKTKEAEPARAYLRERKLRPGTVKAFGIGYAPKRRKSPILTWAKKHGYTVEELVSAGIILPPKPGRRADDYYDRFKGRLMFPICDRQGRAVAFSGRILDVEAHSAKYVNSPETDIFIKSRVLYALDKAAAKIVKHPRREAIICEGQIDVIRCHASGFETAVASQGTAFTEEHAKLLKKHADSAVLVFDGDAAGRKAALRTGAIFLAEEIPVRVAMLPVGEDPDSLLRDKGPEVFQELLDNALSITAFQVDTLRRAEENPESIDAVNRISQAVMEMLAGCPGAVLRSRLLQEGAELLHLPFSALEADLERMRKEARRKASYSHKREKKTHPPVQASPPTEEYIPGETDELVPPDEGADQPSEEFNGEVGERVPPPDPPPHTEYLLCEQLMECEHDEEVLSLVRTYLPLELITHDFSRGFVATLISSQGDDEALPAYCAAADDVWQPLIGKLIVNKQKMLSARECTPADAVKDLITALWVDHLKNKRGRLSAESTPKNDAERFRLTFLIKSFETQPWDKVSQLMLQSVESQGKSQG